MEAVTLEWVRRRRLRLVDTPAQADVVLSGTIQRLMVIPVSYDSQGRANEYQMSLQAMVQLKDVREEEAEVLWEDKAFSRRTSYAVDPVAVNYFDRQNIAMTELSADFASAFARASSSLFFFFFLIKVPLLLNLLLLFSLPFLSASRTKREEAKFPPARRPPLLVKVLSPLLLSRRETNKTDLEKLLLALLVVCIHTFNENAPSFSSSSSSSSSSSCALKY